MTDELAAALRDLAAALERNKERIDRAVAKTDELCDARSEGDEWSKIVEQSGGTLVIELIGANLDELYGAGGRVRRAMAAELHREGLSMEAIARLFGVTRQRVSALLRSTASTAQANGSSGKDHSDDSAVRANGSATPEFVEDHQGI
jgi:hypothetical protein